LAGLRVGEGDQPGGGDLRLARGPELEGDHVVAGPPDARGGPRALLLGLGGGGPRFAAGRGAPARTRRAPRGGAAGAGRGGGRGMAERRSGPRTGGTRVGRWRVTRGFWSRPFPGAM